MKRTEKKIPCRTKELPKRLRAPAPRMKEIDQEPHVDTGGLFVFVRFDDGYTAKIFSKDDILHRDEEPVLRFHDLQPGEDVLARWTDGNFYNAKVEYTKPHLEHQKVTMKRRFHDAAANRFYASLPSTQHLLPCEPSASQNTVSEDAVPPDNSPAPVQVSVPKTPLYSEASGLPKSTFRPALPAVFATPNYSHSVAAVSSKPLLPPVVAAPQTSHPATSSPRCLALSASQNFSCNLSTVTSVSHVSEPQMPLVYKDLDQPRNSQEHHELTPRESFLGMLLSPKPTSHQESFSSDSTVILDRSPISEPGEPTTPESRPWQPCRSCMPQVSKVMEENQKMGEVISSISMDQVKTIRTFCDRIEQYHTASRESPASGMGQQELYPGCQLYISSFRLAAIHQSAQHDCLRLFHLLFEHFFTDEECANSVAFGRHGKCPEGKEMLDQGKVNTILTYVMRFSSVDGWKPVELAKLKKAFINKCRHRAAKSK